MRIAHLSDVHLLELDHARRPLRGRARLRFLSFLRPLDAEARARRFRDALAAAAAARCDHVIVTGDLTEDGTPEQFELAARILLASGLRPEAITLVPGNHDAYDSPGAWNDALEGPLAPFRRSSRTGIPLPLGPVTILPIATAVHQSVATSYGVLYPEDAERIESAACDYALRDRPLCVALHHPVHGARATEPFVGLRGARRLASILERFPNVYAVHGHVHEVRSVAGSRGALPRVHACRAVVDGGDVLRVYESRGGLFVPRPAASAAAWRGRRAGGLAAASA